MKYPELTIGKDYVLFRGGRPVRVTVLETPDELVSKGRVRTRFVSGVKAGEEYEQPLNAIYGPRPKSPAELTEPAEISHFEGQKAPWPPSPGDRVLWPNHPTTHEWEVVELDPDQPLVRVRGIMFSRSMAVEAALSQLRPIEIRVRRSSPQIKSAPLPRDRSSARYVPSEPIAPGEFVPRTVERMSFSEGPLRRYHRKVKPDLSFAAACEALRTELTKEGRPVLNRRGYVTIQTPRVEIHLTNADRDAEFIQVRHIMIREDRPTPGTRKARPCESR